MTDRRDDRTANRQRRGDEPADLRVGRHAIGLLEAARATGDVALIAQAEAMAAAAGHALAARLRHSARPHDD